MEYKQCDYNQSGQTAIMFAIFMSIILSILAVGFATLSINDQRQTLDKSLSFQATYAAESALNYVQRQILQSSMSSIPSIPSSNSNCNPTDSTTLDSTTLNFIHNINTALSNANIMVTCLRWSDKVPTLVYNIGSTPTTVPITPYNSISQAQVPLDGNGLNIQWSALNNSAATAYNINPPLSTLAQGLSYGSTPHIPTLKVAIASSSNINQAQVVYLVPTSIHQAQALSINFNQVRSSDSGIIGSGSCQSASCTITLKLLPSIKNAFLSISSLNNEALVNISAASPNVYLGNAQMMVDATARSQDVTKRLVAYFPIGIVTWQPGFVVSSDNLLKKSYPFYGN